MMRHKSSCGCYLCNRHLLDLPEPKRFPPRPAVPPPKPPDDFEEAIRALRDELNNQKHELYSASMRIQQLELQVSQLQDLLRSHLNT